MAGETYQTPGAVVAGDAARASWAQKVHEALVIAGKQRYLHLGGDELVGHSTAASTYERLRSAMPVDLCEEDYRGLTVTLRVMVRVADASATVRVRLRNTDDGSDVAEIAAVSDTTLTMYEVACTLPAGTTPKSCRLEIYTSDVLYPAFAIGGLVVEL